MGVGAIMVGLGWVGLGVVLGDYIDQLIPLRLDVTQRKLGTGEKRLFANGRLSTRPLEKTKIFEMISVTWILEIYTN